jgi:hypothetical protein
MEIMKSKYFNNYIFSIPYAARIICGSIKIACFFALFGLGSCKKLVDVAAPPTSISGTNVYNTDATAIGVMTGVYTQMSDNYALGNGISSLSYYAGLSADEFNLFSGSTGPVLFYYQDALNSQNASGTDFWNAIYPLIYTTNSVLTGVGSSGSLTPAVKQQLQGEAKFIRAFCYFNLVNIYGDVPLTTTTDYTVNSTLSRSPKADVYKQIIQDLLDAENLIGNDFLDATLLKSTDERVRPNKAAVSALLARVYLYNNNFTDAYSEAGKVISDSRFQLTPIASQQGPFTKNGAEAIWQLQPVIDGENTPDGWLFNLQSFGLSYSNPVYLSKYLLNSFEAGDQRKVYWVNSITNGGQTYYFPYKYQSAAYYAPVTEYETVFRLAEQYLIRAEAEANGAGGGLNAAG